MLLDLLKVVAVFLGIIFLAYTIPRLVTYAICISFYEAKMKFFEMCVKKFKSEAKNEIK
jgi:hypothetical protein